MILSITLATPSCTTEKQRLTRELQGSFKIFLSSVATRNAKGLETSVYFPGVSDYKGHVSRLLLKYLDDAQEKEFIEFDPQGVVLSRFLGLNELQYVVKDVAKSEDGATATMRIGVHFAYDNNIAYDIRTNTYPKGTTVLIPGKPWGKVVKIVLGEAAPIPREQLKYLEIVTSFRKTNYEGRWQLRACEIDEDSVQFEISLRDRFE